MNDNNINTNYNNNEINQIDSNNEFNMNLGVNSNDFQYQSFDDGTSNEPDSDNNGEEKQKSKLIIVLLFIVILFVLGIIGWLIYSNFFVKKEEKVEYVDSITVENGTLSSEFVSYINEYSIETNNDTVKIVCTYKGKKSNIDGCNETINININEVNSHIIKINNIDYIFQIVRVNDEAPIINDVSGKDKDWSKSIKLDVKATFKNGANEKAYSFDGGKTYQKESYKTFNVNKTISIVVKDSKNNISSVYTVVLDKIDSKAPTIDISQSDSKVIAATLKDSESGLVGYIVTKNTDIPSSWTKLTNLNDTVIKYNAKTDGTYYLWTIDGVGNTAYKKFIIKDNTGSSQEPTGSDSNDPEPTTPDPVKESISISGVSGNTKNYVNNITLNVAASSNISGAKLVYSFDGGKSYQDSNTKTFNTNGQISIIVKNKNTNVLSNVSVVNLTTIDNTAPLCGNISGASTTWTNKARTITVACSDSGSGCVQSNYSSTFGSTTKTSNIIIKDKAGNTTLCPVNVYVDTTGPVITYETFTKTEGINKGKIYKFQVLYTDKESGVNTDSIKYKEKVLVNGVDNIWHTNWDNTLETEKNGKIITIFKSTKEIGIYNYFVIYAKDNAGNETEININIK